MAADNFVVCPLCGALNVVENEECFVCSWHGTFDASPDLVEGKLEEIVRQCPGLSRTQPELTRSGLFHRVFHIVTRLVRRPLDLWA